MSRITHTEKRLRTQRVLHNVSRPEQRGRTLEKKVRFVETNLKNNELILVAPVNSTPNNKIMQISFNNSLSFPIDKHTYYSNKINKLSVDELTCVLNLMQLNG